MKLKAVFLLLLAVGFSSPSFSFTFMQDTTNVLGGDNAITTAVPFLTISPDARHAALGDAGVASSADANAAYWNVAKLVFIDKKIGGTISYTPWLGKIVNDMSISYLSGFYKITHEQAVAVSMKYFDLGDIFFKDGNGGDLGDYNPREFAFDLTYSRLLTENLSLGVAARYIHSNLTGGFSGSGVDAKAGKSVAADIGVYYTKSLRGAKSSSVSFGATITNIGGKISYTDADNKDFLPTNLRFGGVYRTELDPYNSLTFLLDFNKLLVPSPGSDRDSVSILSGIFGSFSDAPGGAKEEFQEFVVNTGLEYWYRDVFAGRIGYFNESKNKGNRKYMTFGAGFRKNKFGIDIAYLVPVNKREHPLAETIRFTLLFQINETDLDRDESVTD